MTHLQWKKKGDISHWKSRVGQGRRSIFRIGRGGGGGKSKENFEFFDALGAQSCTHCNIKLCARSAPQTWKLCMLVVFLSLSNLMVLFLHYILLIFKLSKFSLGGGAKRFVFPQDRRLWSWVNGFSAASRRVRMGVRGVQTPPPPPLAFRFAVCLFVCFLLACLSYPVSGERRKKYMPPPPPGHTACIQL